jgi:hypothetical protein
MVRVKAIEEIYQEIPRRYLAISFTKNIIPTTSIYRKKNWKLLILISLLVSFISFITSISPKSYTVIHYTVLSKFCLTFFSLIKN